MDSRYGAGVIKSCYQLPLSDSVVSISLHLSATMPEVAADFATATVKRLRLDKLTSEKKDLKVLLETRDNELVLEHLRALGDKREENYRVIHIFF